jgi:hypothetical protein
LEEEVKEPIKIEEKEVEEIVNGSQ